MRRLVKRRGAQLLERRPATPADRGLLLEEGDLPVVVAERRDAAVVGPVEELAPRPVGLALERRHEVVAVEMDLVGPVADLLAGQQLLLDAGLAGGGEQRRQHVLVGGDVVDDGARLDHARPADQRRHAVAALPVGVLLAAEHGGAAVGPGEGLGTVVGRVHHDGVVGDAELVELGEQLADLAVVLDHAVGVDPEAGHPLRLRLEVGEDVHAGGVPPHEERLSVRMRLVHEGERLGGDLLVDRFHALPGQRTGVLDLSACRRRGRTTGSPRAGRTAP